ncbi:hypothetical protein QWZ16_01355 [Vibrio ostreicida]|uniref:Uncharacterized protein n=1 Tax=Vibrio ostreicida TaxID=526588 RepID=A0ABT8BP21_9VIBR|nr:hypothetical protein [Vibrio ostreicida]MDN3608424.1 hypothetical protein [Vibrio ostreicida]
MSSIQMVNNSNYCLMTVVLLWYLSSVSFFKQCQQSWPCHLKSRLSPRVICKFNFCGGTYSISK